MSTQNQRCDAGEKWLDENVPEWYKNINLNTLDLYWGNNCVVGQLERNVGAFVTDELLREYNLIYPGELGFATASPIESFISLTKNWKRRIRKRLKE